MNAGRPLKHLLQGRPLGLPLHAILVHLPIGLWAMSFVLDVLALAKPDAIASFAKGALYTLLAGLAFAVLAAATGFADYLDVRKDHPSHRTANWHMILNLIAIAVFAASAALRLGEFTPAWLAVATSGVGVVLIGFSGYLGGAMVYDDGIGVGRHRRTHDALPETLRVNAPPDDGYVEVIDSDELSDSVPLRAHVNGHVMVLVRVNGTVCAVQEFCTHRCGPMSEGTVADGKIECPWHRSQFDVRSGKVTEGPARLDLKTYPAREERGRVAVKIG